MVVFMISPANLKPIPAVKLIPAAFATVTTENGFTVDIMVPMEDPIYIATIHTNTSYNLF